MNPMFAHQTAINFKKYIVFAISVIVCLALFIAEKRVESSANDRYSVSVNGVSNEVEADTQEPAKLTRDDASKKNFKMLAEKIQSSGNLNLIVKLRVAFKPETRFSKQPEVKLQRASIRRVREELVRDLHGYDPASVKSYDYIPYVALKVNSTGLASLQASDLVDSVEEDTLLATNLETSIPLIGGNRAWELGYTGQGQTIAIIDTGVSKNHPFLAGKVVSEACYSTTDPDGNASSTCPNGVNASTAINSGLPCNGVNACDHGTHVAGIAAGRGADFSGVAKDANIIAINVFSRIDNRQVCAQGRRSSPCILAYQSDIVMALMRVYELRTAYNIAAVNLSLGGGAYTSECDAIFPSYTDAINILRGFGIAVVAASGNDGEKKGISSPACISSVISVGSTTNQLNEKVVESSNSSPLLKLLAPGEAILSSVGDSGQFELKSGTSMAAPHVAGAIALLRQKSPTLSIADALSALTSSGKFIFDPVNGIPKPRIQIDAALALIKGSVPVPTVPVTPTGLAARLIGADKIDLSWSDNSTNENGFIIYRRVGSSGGWLPLAMASRNTSSYQDSDLQPDTNYFYQIKAFNDFGESNPSNVVNLTTPKAPVVSENLLRNGSFELDEAKLGATSLNGWTVVTGNVDIIPNSENVLWAWHQSADGSKSLELTGNPGSAVIEQQFPTQVGRKYLLSGWVAHHYGVQIAGATISINGTLLTPLIRNGFVSQSDMKWERFSREFVATSSVTVLRLTDLNLAQWPFGGMVVDGLSVVQMSGESLAPNNAEFVGQLLPSSMNAGEKVRVSVTMKNTGSNEWTAYSGYKLGTQNPQDNTLWGVGTRLDLNPNEVIRSGETKVFSFEIKAPDTPGTYDFQMKMLREGVEWFGQPTSNQRITVRPVEVIEFIDAQFISQNIPTRISPGQVMNAFVTLKNTGKVSWSTLSGFSLGVRSPQNPEILALGTRIQLAPGEIIGPGQEKRFSFQLKAPDTPGIHNIQMQMRRESTGWFGQLTPQIQVTVPFEQSGTISAQFVSQNIPTTITPGQVVTGSVTMRNSGTMAWSSLSGFKLAATNAQNSSLFGLNSAINLGNGEIIGPGQLKKFDFQLRAPEVPGIYPIQFQMFRDGVGWFGETTRSVQIVVPIAGNTNIDAAFVIQSIPVTITPGQVVNASITMRNSGTLPWSSMSGFYLALLSQPVSVNWGFGDRINLDQGEIIGPGQEKKFTFQIKAPDQPGLYNLQMRMHREGYGGFGQTTRNVQITVPITSNTNANSRFVIQSVPNSLSPGQVVTAYVTMRNTGSIAWSSLSGFSLRVQNPENNAIWGFSGILDLAPGELIGTGQERRFTFQIKAPEQPGIYNFQMQMYREGFGWFGELTRNVQVTVQQVANLTADAEFVIQNIPSYLAPGQVVTASITMQNTGTVSWSAGSGFKLGFQDPQAAIWGFGSRLNLDYGEVIAPGQVKRFDFQIKAPEILGTYNFQMKMVREGVSWFGSLTPNIEITVSDFAKSDPIGSTIFGKLMAIALESFQPGQTGLRGLGQIGVYTPPFVGLETVQINRIALEKQFEMKMSLEPCRDLSAASPQSFST